MSSDNTCVLSGVGSRNNVDPLLAELGQYGGSTQVHMLRLGSPAIDGVLGSDAPTTDQRGKPHPQGSGYDIGAVEWLPTYSDVVPRVYLPAVINKVEVDLGELPRSEPGSRTMAPGAWVHLIQCSVQRYDNVGDSMHS